MNESKKALLSMLSAHELRDEIRHMETSLTPEQRADLENLDLATITKAIKDVSPSFDLGNPLVKQVIEEEKHRAYTEIALYLASL